MNKFLFIMLVVSGLFSFNVYAEKKEGDCGCGGKGKSVIVK
jgi:hypothetical protein